MKWIPSREAIKSFLHTVSPLMSSEERMVWNKIRGALASYSERLEFFEHSPNAHPYLKKLLKELGTFVEDLPVLGKDEMWFFGEGLRRYESQDHNSRNLRMRSTSIRHVP